MSSEQFSLCWDNFHKNMSLGMSALLENEDLVDVTLAAEGKYLKAHKMVLSVCSPYFKELFKTNPCKHPIVFMKDVSYVALSDLLQFMYQGEVQVSQENLSTFIKTAEALQIKGLTGDGNGSAETELDNEKSVQQLVEDCEPYKQNQTLNRPKKVAQAMPLQSSKRQRLSTSTNESLTSVSKTKTQPDQDFSEEIQFKMEPYEQTQTITINEEEQYDGDSMNDTAGEETEDYSIIEGTEDEPQAGTSADGAGEGQGTIYFVAGVKNPKLILDECTYRLYNKFPNKTVWLCNMYYLNYERCKSRIITTGRVAYVYGTHNHEIKKIKINEQMSSQTITIIRMNEFTRAIISEHKCVQ